jgi:hypothetical protein
MRVVGILDRQGQLLEVIDRLGPPCSLSCGLNRRQKERDEDAHDCNHNQKLHYRETKSNTSAYVHWESPSFKRTIEKQQKTCLNQTFKNALGVGIAGDHNFR